MAGIREIELIGLLQDSLLGHGLPPRQGQVIQGVIESVKGGLALRVGDSVLSITGDAIANLQAGQQVSAEVVQTDQGFRLRLLPPQATPTPPAFAVPSRPAGDPVSAVLISVLESLGKVEAAPQAAQLLPPTRPPTQAAVRLVLSLFLTQDSTGEDLQTLTRITGQAAILGALSKPDEDAFAALVRQWLPPDTGRQALDNATAPRPDPAAQPPALQERDPTTPAAFVRHAVESHESFPARAVQSAAERAGHPLEARLATALVSGRLEMVLAELDQDMRTQLERLRRNGPFVEFLRQTGQQTSFDQAMHRVLDRSSGTQLQNLRGLDLPYQFLEIPFPPQAPIRNAQVHIFGEGRGRRQPVDPQNAAVAIDLATTRLGDLWISLAIHQGVCRCWIRARTSDVVQAVEAHAAELTDRLSALGYPGARVRASLWNGDRLAEVVSLVAQFKKVDFQA